MRKLIAVILSLYYVTAIAGLAVSVHYCHGEIEAVGVFTEAKGCCDESGTCCTCCLEEEYLVKADVDDQLTASYKFEFNPENTFGILLLLWDCHFNTLDEPSSRQFTEQPLPPKAPIWLLNSNLTFYG